MDAAASRLLLLLGGSASLSAHLAAGPLLDEFAKQQMDAACLEVSKIKQLTLEQANKIAAQIKQVPFLTEADQQKLLHCIVAKASESTPAENSDNRRGALQNYTSLSQYLTPNIWNAVANPSYSEQAKLDLLVKFAMQLGLRVPSEPTYAVMLAIINLAAGADPNLSPSELYQQLQSIKMRTRKLLESQSSEEKPLQYQSLPADAQSLLNTEHGQLLFKEEKPGGCPFSLAKLDAYVKQIPLRCSNSNARSSFLPLQRQTNSQPSSYADMFGMLMHQHQQLQRMQPSLKNEPAKAESSLAVVPFVPSTTPDLSRTELLALPAPAVIETPLVATAPAIDQPVLPAPRPVAQATLQTIPPQRLEQVARALRSGGIQSRL